MSERPIFFATPIHRIRAERKKRLRELWLSIGVLIALVVLVVWMIAVIQERQEAGGTRHKAGVSELLPVALCPLPIHGLAMAPVTEGSVLGLVTFACLVGLMVLARRWWDDQEAFYALLREAGQRQEAGGTRPKLDLHDPFAGITDGLDGDEMHRLLTSVAAEAREVRRMMAMAWAKANDTEQIRILDRGSERLSVLIRCVESLCERLQPCIDETEFNGPRNTRNDTENGGIRL